MRIMQKPRFSISEVAAGLCVAIGFLLFLINLHVMAIENTGGTAEVLSSTFGIALIIYIFLVVMWVVYVIYKLLAYLTWAASTPKLWKMRQEQMRRRRGYQ